MSHLKKPKAHNLATDPSSALDTLSHLRIRGEGLYTSEGEHFNHTLFARDSAIAARELLERDPRIAHDVILMLASRQGTERDDNSDEEPGKIHHEDRDMDKWQAGTTNRLVRSAMSVIWGGTPKKMMTYFSMDSTPLYMILVSEYAALYPEILSETVTQQDGRDTSIATSLEEAADWIMSHKTKYGLIEVPRHNKYGLAHQTWKDSLTAYIHRNGESLNLSQPIAYLEVQVLVVDALRGAYSTLRKHVPKKARLWEQASNEIAESTLKNFWQEDSQFFISSIDKDHDGHPRRNTIEQSDPGWMLHTKIFDNLSASERKKYITGIITTLFSNKFLTDAGIRTRSVIYAKTLDVVDYHGSLVTWPIDTYMIAKGLRKQGFPKLAEQLEIRILNAINTSGDFYEFFFVEEDGTVIFDLKTAQKKLPGAKTLSVQLLPDTGIAWSVTAALMIKESIDHPEENSQSAAWKKKLEVKILRNMPHVTLLETKKEMEKKFAIKPNVYLSTLKGDAKSIGDLFEAFRLRLNIKPKK